MKKDFEVGMQFHTWEVIKEDNTKRNGYYLCKCTKCGAERSIRKYNLLDNSYGLCKNCGLADLLEDNIDLIKTHWNNDLNKEVTLEELKLKTSKTYWFTCSNNHNYKKTIRDFIHDECPTCKKQKMDSDDKAEEINYYSFAKCYPHLVPYYNRERNIISPYKLHPSRSKKKYSFTCQYGHEFSRSTFEISEGKWCPCCFEEAYIRKMVHIFENIHNKLNLITAFKHIMLKDFNIVLELKLKIGSSKNKISNISTTKNNFSYKKVLLTGNLKKDVDCIKNIMLQLA